MRRGTDMQLSSVANTPPPQPVATIPPTTSARATLPHELQVARIGKGTVRSEVDRSIRVLLAGDGPPSTREIVADSKAAVDLVSSKDGPTFVRAIRSFLEVADPHVGKENLKSITLLPDEHASKGVAVLHWAERMAGDGTSADVAIEPEQAQLDAAHAAFPQFSRDQVRGELRRLAAAEGAKLIAAPEAEDVSFSGAWNSDGHIVMMPDVSRDMLASVGLYRTQPGDQLTKTPVEHRADQARWSWHAALHEAHHSITPPGDRGEEWSSVLEEAVAEVLTPASIAKTLRAAGADPALAARPARDTKREAVDWKAWNRDHLPQPAAAEVATAEGRYTDGPALVRDLLRMAHIDRRTTTGKAAALEILQGDHVNEVPGRLADAIVAAKGLPASTTGQLEQLIQQAAVGEGSTSTIKQFLQSHPSAG
jgi:hypothetical protein